MTYNWQQSDWPNFTYLINKVVIRLYQHAQTLGKMEVHLNQLPATERQDVVLQLMGNVNTTMSH